MVPGLEVLDHLMMSRRGVDLLLQVAVLQELGLEKQEVLEELEVEHWHMAKEILTSSYILLCTCEACVYPRTRDRCLMQSHCHQQRN